MVLARSRIGTQPVEPQKRFQKRPVKKRLAFYAVAALIMFYLLSNLTGKALGYFQLQSELDNLQRHYGEIEMENRLLQDEISNWQDTAFLERQAREKLGMIREGEISFWLVD